MKADFPDGKASWRCGRAEIHCCTHPVGADERCEDTLEARDIQGDAMVARRVLRPSLETLASLRHGRAL
jgi:hypothetical protein